MSWLALVLLASLAGPQRGDAEARRRAFADNLAARGLVRVGDRVLPGTPRHGTGVPDEPHHATIYLNFAGGTLRSGSIAAQMESTCVGALEIDYPAFDGDDAQAMAIVQVFRNAMAPYAVRIATGDPPPAHLPYSMVMMGGQATDLGLEPGALGVSCSTDCGDVWWRDTTFAFTESSSNTVTLGNVALQEAAHAFGLDHIEGGQHIMYPLATSGDKTWASECTPYDDSTGGIGCTYVHDVFCGPDAGMQNDHAELLAFFGADVPDVSPPVVTLLEPPDGLELDAGGSVPVEVEVTDDHQGVGWRLRVMPHGGDEQIVVAYHFERTWNLAALPDGTYTIRVEAIDHDGNEGADEVTIVVGTGVVATTGDVDGTSDGSGSSTSTDGSSGAPPPASDDGAPGCGCDLTGPSAGALDLLWCALLRRRRPTRSRGRQWGSARAP